MPTEGRHIAIIEVWLTSIDIRHTQCFPRMQQSGSWSCYACLN